MERLTEKRDGQNVIPLIQDGKTKWSLCSAGMGDAPTQFLYGDHADRLAEYEGLEEQGKLLKLPCAVGDTVYELSHKMLPLRIDSYEIETDEIYANLVSDVYGYKYLKICVDVANFSKTVFLTKSAAEQALKEMEDRKNER